MGGMFAFGNKTNAEEVVMVQYEPIPTWTWPGGTEWEMLDRRRPFPILKPRVLLGRFFGEYVNNDRRYNFMNPSWLVAERVAEKAEKLKLPLDIQFCDLPVGLDYDLPGTNDSMSIASAQCQDISGAIAHSLRLDWKQRIPYQVVLLLGVAPHRCRLSIERHGVPWWRLSNDPTRWLLPGYEESEIVRSTLPNQAIIDTCLAYGVPIYECDMAAEDGAVPPTGRPGSCNAAMVHLAKSLRNTTTLGGLMHVVKTPTHYFEVTHQPLVTEYSRELDVQAVGVIIALLVAVHAQGFALDEELDDLIKRVLSVLSPLGQ
jgi:pyrrolidone-carboxylate peptidase